MKHNDKTLSAEIREDRENTLNERGRQLGSVTNQNEEAGIKYLFLVNSGGAVTVLAYLGAHANNTAPSCEVIISLVLYFLGVVTVGVYWRYMVYWGDSVQKKFGELVREYETNAIGWSEINKRDEENVGSPFMPLLLAYISFGCFIVGSVAGALGLL